MNQLWNSWELALNNKLKKEFNFKPPDIRIKRIFEVDFDVCYYQRLFFRSKFSEPILFLNVYFWIFFSHVFNSTRSMDGRMHLLLFLQSNGIWSCLDCQVLLWKKWNCTLFWWPKGQTPDQQKIGLEYSSNPDQNRVMLLLLVQRLMCYKIR
jgi:hypothetical protein